MTALIEAEVPFESDELSLADYIAIIKRRWWLIVAGALLLGLVAFIFSMLQTRTYQSSAEVLLRTSGNDQLFPSVPFTQQVDVRRSVLAEVDFIQSDTFFASLDDAGVTESVTVRVPEVDTGDRNQTGNLLRFTATGSSALGVAESANVAAETYISGRQATALADFQRRAEAEVDELNLKQAELEALDLPITVLQQRIAATSDEAEANRLRDEVSEVRATLTSQRIDLQRAIDTLTSRVDESRQVRAILDDAEISARVNKFAPVPSSPTSPKTLRNLLLGGLLGALGGLGLALLWESLDDKISAEDDVTLLGLTVLASVPVDGEEVEGPRLFARDSESGREMEAYRTARAALNFASDGKLSSFLVTSALPSEGKSTTSANLAAALSLSGQKTLLIDADLRRPTLHKYFDLPNNVGLRSVLAGEADANDVMAVTGFGEMLALISAGAPASYPSELLSNGRLEALIAGAKEVFDVVIVDTPPLFLVSDAALVAPSVDGIVLSVTSGMGDTSASKKSDTRRLVSAVRRLRTPVLGAVMHGGGVGAYGYGYKYGYYSAAPDEAAAPSLNGAPDLPARNGSTPDHAEVGWVEDRINVGRPQG